MDRLIGGGDLGFVVEGQDLQFRAGGGADTQAGGGAVKDGFEGFGGEGIGERRKGDVDFFGTDDGGAKR